MYMRGSKYKSPKESIKEDDTPTLLVTRFNSVSICYRISNITPFPNKRAKRYLYTKYTREYTLRNNTNTFQDKPDELS